MESTNEKHSSKYQRLSSRTTQKLKPRYVRRLHLQEMRKIFFGNIGMMRLLNFRKNSKIMLLNRYNKVIGIFSVSQGGIAGTVADPKLIFGCALKAAASGIILAHKSSIRRFTT